MTLVSPIQHVERIDRRELNRLLVAWGHKMGELRRPVYRFEHHVAMFQHGEPVAVASAGEIPRDVAGDTTLKRSEVTELMRLCAVRPHLCWPMLRLWREMVLPDLLRAYDLIGAVSYQDEAFSDPRDNIYRRDGWRLIGKAGGGGTDARSGRKGRKMRVWGWPRDIARVAA